MKKISIFNLCLAAMFCLAATGCGLANSSSQGSPYTNCTVTGRVVDALDSQPLSNVYVLVWNEWNTKSGTSDSNGQFSIVMTGCDSNSYLRVYSPQPYHTQVRAIQSAINVRSNVNCGTYYTFRQSTIVFTSLAGDLCLVRSDGTGLKKLVSDTNSYTQPRWERNYGSRIGCNRGLSQLVTFNFLGAAAGNLDSLPSVFAGGYIGGWDWAERGTVLDCNTNSAVTEYIDSSWHWDGVSFPDFSPPDFAAWGGLIGGANLLLATGSLTNGPYGIWFLNPYADHQNLAYATGTTAAYVKWSPVINGKNYVLWVENNAIKAAQMNDISTTTPNVQFSGAWMLFSNKNVKQAAWSPDGSNIIAVQTVLDDGNMYLIPFSPTTTTSYTTVLTTNVGKASWVEWY